MKQETTIPAEGTVLEDRSNSMFIVELDNGHQVLCTISGKLRTKNIRILPGDRVMVDVSMYDLTKARIKYRLLANGQAQSTVGSRDTKSKNRRKGGKKR